MAVIAKDWAGNCSFGETSIMMVRRSGVCKCVVESWGRGELVSWLEERCGEIGKGGWNGEGRRDRRGEERREEEAGRNVSKLHSILFRLLESSISKKPYSQWYPIAQTFPITPFLSYLQCSTNGNLNYWMGCYSASSHLYQILVTRLAPPPERDERRHKREFLDRSMLRKFKAGFCI